jgi:hypothetical protein
VPVSNTGERHCGALRRSPEHGNHERGVVVMKRILGPVLVSLTLAACGTSAPAPRTPATSAEPRPVVATDCGTFDLPQGGRLPGSAARCLSEAVQAGRPARLAVSRLTVEGDRIPATYTAGTDGRVEVVTDSRQDAFGEQIVTRRTCSGPIPGPELEFAECSSPAPVPE